MRTLNLLIIGIGGAFALLLLSIALPTLGDRPLAHWAMNVGATATILSISMVYLLLQLITGATVRKVQVVILGTYIPVVIVGGLSGALWGPVGHVMETEHLELGSALLRVGPLPAILYSLVLLITGFTAFYVFSKRVAQSTQPV